MKEELQEYPFPWPNDDKGYRLFPADLENDELVGFHGTARANLQLIIGGGFAFARSLQSISFASDSSLALAYACSARSGESPEGCVVVVRFRPPVPRENVGRDSGGITVHSLDEQPKIIGYCIVPEGYSHT